MIKINHTAFLLYFSMMKSTQKSIANDASARPEKAMEIQAKGAGLRTNYGWNEEYECKALV
jgi:hypothetical protein